MFSEAAKEEIEQIITKFDEDIRQSLERNVSVNYNEWIDNNQAYVSCLFNGFKRICFDNRDVVYYKKHIKVLEDYWERTKKKLLQIIER